MITKSVARLIEMGIDGFSTTVFCYGQTGSGKTHTLTGPPYLVSFFCLLSESSQIIIMVMFSDILFALPCLDYQFDDHGVRDGRYSLHEQ